MIPSQDCYAVDMAAPGEPDLQGYSPLRTRKRSELSSKPTLSPVREARMGLKFSLAFTEPGPRLTEQRKMLRRGIGPQRIASHNEKFEKHTTKLALALAQFEGNSRELIMK
jgi:cytochrome P450